MAAMETTWTPGIFKRGSRYVVVWRHRGRQHKETFRTLEEAREAQGERRRLDGRRPPTREPFEDYARRWLKTYRGRTARGLAQRTRDNYELALERYAIPHFRRARLAEVEPPDVRDFIRGLERRGLRPATIRGVLAPVRALFATAVEDGVLRVNPTVGVRVTGRRDAPEQREIWAMTREELGRFLAAVPERWRLFFELLAHTGLRISEAIALTWDDVEFGARPRLLIRRQDCRGRVRELKTEQSRRDIPLSRGMAQRLWTQSRGQALPMGNSRVFLTAAGTPLSDTNLRQRVLEPTRDAVGLPWVTFHSFRHTCASLLFEAGRDVKQVQAWLGHADPGFTLRTYVHLMDEGIGDADFLDTAVIATTEGDAPIETARRLSA